MNTVEFEETELRLGLPGGGGNNLKRGFSESIDLKLNLNTPSSSSPPSSSENVNAHQVVKDEENNAKPPAK